MTKLSRIKAKAPDLFRLANRLGKPKQNGVDLPKTKEQILAQRLAVLEMSRKAHESSVIVMPDGSRKEGDPLTGMFFFGMASGLAWVLGEENVPPQLWEMPKDVSKNEQERGAVHSGITQGEGPN